MKKIAFIIMALSTSTAMSDTYVNGYTRDNGTYVQPHQRSDADGSAFNNYSHQGNSNPYTGAEGRRSDSYNRGYNGYSQPQQSFQPSSSYGYGNSK